MPFRAWCCAGAMALARRDIALRGAMVLTRRPWTIREKMMNARRTRDERAVAPPSAALAPWR